MSKGGKRPGAGRKGGVIHESKQVLQTALDNVAKKRGGYESLIGRLWELVEGVEVQKILRDGSTTVYLQPPDAFAAKTLLEFRFGKAPQSMEVTGKDGAPLMLHIGPRNGK